MSAAELRYMIATDSLGGEGVRLTDIANKMGVTKVSVYRMSERLTEMGFMTRCAQSRIALTEKGKNLLCEYMLCIEFICKKLECACRTPSNVAFYEAVNMICAVGDYSRGALVRCLHEKLKGETDGKTEKDFKS